MEFLAFLLALVAVVWALKNHWAQTELQDNQRSLESEVARLRDELARAAPAPAPSPAPPKEPVRERPPVVAAKPPVPTAPPRVVEAPSAPPPPRPPLVTKPAFD